MTDVLVVGSVALDTIETPFGKRENILGGSATHFSLSARNFANVRLVGIVGRDFPEEHTSLLRKLGVDTAGLQPADGLTFRWHGKYQGDMNVAETVSVDLNVFGKFRPEIPAPFRATKYVFLGNASPHTQRYVLDQMEKPEFVLLDTMDFWIRTEQRELRQLMPRVHCLSINHEETMMLAEKPNIALAIREILRRGTRVLVVKKAEHGALLATDKFMFSIPSYPTENVLDPTGAGDSFAGGFLGYLSRHGTGTESLKKALLYGAVMGSFTVEEFGTERLQRVVSKEIDQRADELVRMITL